MHLIIKLISTRNCTDYTISLYLASNRCFRLLYDTFHFPKRHILQLCFVGVLLFLSLFLLFLLFDSFGGDFCFRHTVDHLKFCGSVIAIHFLPIIRFGFTAFFCFSLCSRCVLFSMNRISSHSHFLRVFLWLCAKLNRMFSFSHIPTASTLRAENIRTQNIHREKEREKKSHKEWRKLEERAWKKNCK